MRVALLIAALLVPASASAYDTLDELRACIRGNVPQKAVRQDLGMTHVNRAGKKRDLVGRMYVERSDDDLAQIVMRLQQPRELNKAAYLYLQGSGRIQDKLFGTRDDRVYVYFPAARKARKMSGSTAGSELFGTNLSTDDIRHLFGSLTGGALKRLPDGSIGGRPTYPVEITPRAAGSPYSLVRAHIDARTCLTLKAEFIGRNGKPIKTLSQDPSKISRVDGRFVGHHFTMQDANSSESTQLFLGSVIYDKDISDTLFHPDGFYK